MRIVTNPGSNLSEAALESYRVSLLPQQIIVDGAAHDTRAGVTLETIDGWVSAAKTHPHVVGTTAAEFAYLGRRLATEDRELLVVMTSRKIIGSHDAAVVGAKTLREAKGYEDVHVRVCDSGVTDVGAGLACALAGEALADGHSIDAAAELVESYRKNVRFVFTVRSLDYLVKGGRATTLRRFFANLLGVRPVLAFVDGDIAMLGKESVKTSPAETVAKHLSAGLTAGEPIYAAIFHGGAPTEAAVLAEELRRRFEVLSLTVRTISPSIYLHTGPGGLGCVAVSANALAFRPRSRGFTI